MLKNKDKFINVILILDRAYCSYKFVIRFKNNCINIEKKLIIQINN